MIKFVALLKRKEGMPFEAFKDYYETRHSKLRASIESDHVSRAVRYQRRYLQPVPHPIAQATAGVDFDAIIELWYPDREALDSDMAFLSHPDVRPIYAEDEENLFDRKYIRCYVVEEESPEF
jgi:hypothetical protein